ncbi:hypothetical protein HLB23_31595 [Nocardia uniformis]|uniref:Uncharacterized protein n=1 Tax=Nocardia uniformis TaxID=53432 RepID=A0A849CJA1_9NOCA|nr:hypothetical protein [Nocardia uniformis]NNH74341.1 hypothetical protein [Nocardia uniformis]
MKSMLAAAFVATMAGVVIAAPSAQAAQTAIHTGALKSEPCHVNQTYRLRLSHSSPGADGLTFTDNGVQIPIDWQDYNMSSVDWTPTTTGQHTLRLSGDGTSGGNALITFGSSELVDLASGSGFFQAPAVTVQTTVVNASDTTTPCLR